MVVMLIGATHPPTLQHAAGFDLWVGAFSMHACPYVPHAAIEAIGIAAGVLFFGFLIGAVGEFLEVGSKSWLLALV